MRDPLENEYKYACLCDFRPTPSVWQRTAAASEAAQNAVMDTSHNPHKKPHPAAYALHRQMAAVQRTMTAASVMESERASRWAHAWYMLVQRKLEDLQHAPRYLH